MLCVFYNRSEIFGTLFRRSVGRRRKELYYPKAGGMFFLYARWEKNNEPLFEKAASVVYIIIIFLG
jgi:hypothetical protein